MGTAEKAYPFYPEPSVIDAWCDSIWESASAGTCQAEVLPDAGWRNNFGDYQARSQIIKFTPEGLPPFYGAWQGALVGPAPLVVHLPGYGGELSVHPEIAAKGFNVLNLSPLGYWTPDGFAEEFRDKQTLSWPVLQDTLRSNGEHGYKEWLRCVIYSVQWAWRLPVVLPDRVSFYGTSQGGGTAILAGSLFKDHGIRCIAADEPFLTDYPQADCTGAYEILRFAVAEQASKEEAYAKAAVADTLAHTHRIECPILVTEGTNDTVCPPPTVRHLFSRLGATCGFISFKDRYHGYAYEFSRLAEMWFGMYA